MDDIYKELTKNKNKRVRIIDKNDNEFEGILYYFDKGIYSLSGEIRKVNLIKSIFST